MRCAFFHVIVPPMLKNGDLRASKMAPRKNRPQKVCVRMCFSDFFFSTFQNEMSNVCPRARHFALKSPLLRSRYIFRPARRQPANFFFRPRRLSGGVHRQASPFWGRVFCADATQPPTVTPECDPASLPRHWNGKRGLRKHQECKIRHQKTSFSINSAHCHHYGTYRLFFTDLQAPSRGGKSSGARKARF